MQDLFPNNLNTTVSKQINVTQDINLEVHMSYSELSISVLFPLCAPQKDEGSRQKGVPSAPKKQLSYNESRTNLHIAVSAAYFPHNKILQFVSSLGH